jgi:hypothetical protein
VPAHVFLRADTGCLSVYGSGGSSVSGWVEAAPGLPVRRRGSRVAARAPRYPNPFDDRLILPQQFAADPLDPQALTLQLGTDGRHIPVFFHRTLKFAARTRHRSQATRVEGGAAPGVT